MLATKIAIVAKNDLSMRENYTVLSDRAIRFHMVVGIRGEVAK
jgi:hypothetical protein